MKHRTILLLCLAITIVSLTAVGNLEEKNAAAIQTLKADKPTPVKAVHIATPEPAPIETPEAEPEPRLTLTADEIDLIARIVWHEARGESAEGQRAAVEVIFNRVEADNFPDTVEGVILQKNQFSSAKYIDSAEPSDEQFEAIEQALYEEPMLPGDVVYFSRGAENGRVYKTIGNHTFCRQYEWG